MINGGKTMEFVYENQGHITYLSYAMSHEDILDTLTLGMITNNKISGLAPSIFTQMDTTKYIKYNVSAKIPVKQFFSGTVTKKNLLGVFKGIVLAVLAAEDYMIDVNSIVFDLNYMFVDVSNCEVDLICLPLQQSVTTTMDLNLFLKNIMFSTQFDQSENCDYVAKIINYLNASPVLSLEDFKVMIDSLSNVSAESTVVNVVETKKESVLTEGNVSPVQIAQPITIPSPSNIQKPAIQSQVAVASKVTIPPTTNKPITPIVPQPMVEKATETPVKKKVGLFGLFSSGEKKQKSEKAVPIPQNKMSTMPNTTGNKFSIPGQKVPIQNTSNSFAIPGKKVPINSQPIAKEQNAQKIETATSVVPQTVSALEPIVDTSPVVQQPTVAPQQTQYQPPLAPQGQAMNFGETTVLGGGNIGETTVLGIASTETVQENPHLIRSKNNEKINLNKPVFRIGKEKSYVDYFIGDNTAISRSHANFITRDGQYFVMDTNSTNHTYVNGVMIQSNIETQLSHGDKIRLANEDFEFKLF